MRQFQELLDSIGYYLAAKSDSARLHVRNTLLDLVFACGAFVVVTSLAVTGMWFILSGFADGLGAVLGERPWVGRIVTGFLLTTTLWIGTRLVVVHFTKAALHATVAGFEQRKSRQRTRYGRSVADRNGE